MINKSLHVKELSTERYNYLFGRYVVSVRVVPPTFHQSDVFIQLLVLLQLTHQLLLIVLLCTLQSQTQQHVKHIYYLPPSIPPKP